MVSGPAAGRAGIEIVPVPASSAARCARPTGGSIASVKVVLRRAAIGAGVVIRGASTKAATLDSTPRSESSEESRIEIDRMHHLHRVQSRLQIGGTARRSGSR